MPYTDEQHQILAHSGGHARIIAVAGSGKTATLTAYLARALSAGANPRRLLVLMYNKAAQQDFSRRLQQLSPNLALPEVRTFHSLGYRLYQRLVQEGDLAPFQRTLLTDSQVEPLVWRWLRELADDDLAEDILNRKKKWVEPAMTFIELVKSGLDDPAEVFEQSGLPAQCALFVEVFERFEQWRKDQRRITFSDLLYDPVCCFEANPTIAQRYAGHMAEILVDEYQDINPIQQRLLHHLHGGRGQLLVVGDPDQTIYEFRGSEPGLLTDHFSQAYTPVTDYQLSWTFRYGHCLSLMANQLMSRQAFIGAERTLCLSYPGTPDTQVEAMQTSDSAQSTLASIQSLSADYRLSDIAVLNRLWANCARLELLLLASNLPYHLDHHQGVLERYELQPFSVLLDLAQGTFAQYDAEQRRRAWRAILTQPYLKIRKAVVDDLVERLQGVAHDTARHLRNAIPESLSSYQADQLMARARLLQEAEAARGTAADLISGWIRATDYYEAMKDNAFSVQQVDDQTGTVKAFAAFVSQQGWTAAEAAQALRDLQQRRAQADQDAIYLTSIHKAKGRQWPVVIIPELNDRYFPYHPEGDLSRPTSEASERRLLYVAMTRAQQRLYLLTPDHNSEDPPSPFWNSLQWQGCKTLAEALKRDDADVTLPDSMDTQMVQRYLNAIESPLRVHWHTTEVEAGPIELAPQRVHHRSLGVGRVLEQDQQRLTIRFVSNGKTRQFDRETVWPLLTWL